MVDLIKDLSNIVVIGSCSIDFTTYAPRLPNPGETLKGTKFKIGFGGKGANQCLTAAKLGEIPHMICRLGEDTWGTKYANHLRSNNVNIKCVMMTPDITTGVAQITVAEDGQNQIVIVPGANACLSDQDVENELVGDVIKNAKVLIGQLETPFESTLKAFQLCDKGITILNAAPMTTIENIRKIISHCYVLCVNETEASMLINCAVEVSNVATALTKLMEIKNDNDKGCKIAVITLGEDGAAYIERRDMKPVLVKSDPVKPVDTTGAGDAFVGALATFLLKEMERRPLHEIVAGACRVASHSVTLEGAQTDVPHDVFGREYQYSVLES